MHVNLVNVPHRKNTTNAEVTNEGVDGVEFRRDIRRDTKSYTTVRKEIRGRHHHLHNV